MQGSAEQSVGEVWPNTGQAGESRTSLASTGTWKRGKMRGIGGALGHQLHVHIALEAILALWSQLLIRQSRPYLHE